MSPSVHKYAQFLLVFWCLILTSLPPARALRLESKLAHAINVFSLSATPPTRVSRNNYVPVRPMHSMAGTIRARRDGPVLWSTKHLYSV
jgi:hypothetical protein